MFECKYIYIRIQSSTAYLDSLYKYTNSANKVYSIYFYYVSTSYGVSYLPQSSLVNIH